ncbi:unnamed protein product, partial [Ectocarpus sp. 12 AP-2014]
VWQLQRGLKFLQCQPQALRSLCAHHQHSRLPLGTKASWRASPAPPPLLCLRTPYACGPDALVLRTLLPPPSRRLNRLASTHTCPPPTIRIIVCSIVSSHMMTL